MVSYKAAEWRGKGVKYWFRYCYRNCPEVMISIPFYLVFVPGFVYFYYKKFDDWHFKNTRFLSNYKVLRPDDPRVRDVLKFDSSGNRIFLEPKQKSTV